jgi:hypothetical protein
MGRRKRSSTTRSSRGGGGKEEEEQAIKSPRLDTNCDEGEDADDNAGESDNNNNNDDDGDDGDDEDHVEEGDNENVENQDEEMGAEEEEEEEGLYEAQGGTPPKQTQSRGGKGKGGTKKRSTRGAASVRESIASPLQKRAINERGKPAEAGVIKRVQVENFMCHRKLTVDLCRNVNFIHGQNGSGKSAVLAALQICLGAGARRTHRARNLKDLIRKGPGGVADGQRNAKVRVTLYNEGDDAFQHDTYGDEVTVERVIASSSGGYNGYRLLDSDGNEQSRLKKDLDSMLDQLNIQVENPVAVLDQEEAKKFLMGKPEDKYNFFMKATELDRLDRTYANIQDNLLQMEEDQNRIRKSLETSKQRVKKLEKEWNSYQELEGMKDKIKTESVNYAWSLVKDYERQKEEMAKVSACSVHVV